MNWHGGGTEGSGLSSLKEDNRDIEIEQGKGALKNSYEVNTISYNDLISKYGIKAVTLFSLDVEGAELSVIEGMKNCEVLPDYFCIEANHFNFNELRNKIEDLGFHFDCFYEANALFIKNNVWTQMSDKKKKFLESHQFSNKLWVHKKNQLNNAML